MKNPNRSIAENALADIKSKKISPKAKWQCLFFGKLAWIFSLFFIIIGSLAFSVILYMVLNNDWDLYTHFNHSFLEFLFATLPYFWIVILIVLSLLAIYSSKFTEDAYRYKLVTLIFVGSGLNFVLGGAFYAIGMGELIDSRLQEEIPTYHYLSYSKEKMWTQPENGILSGEILRVGNEGVAIEDYLGNFWDIKFGNNTIVKGRSQLSVGVKIKIIGNKIENKIFLASEIRPWMGNNFGCKNMHGCATQ